MIFRPNIGMDGGAIAQKVATELLWILRVSTTHLCTEPLVYCR